MLFFTRAFLCIGTIVVLAEGLGPADLWTKSKDAAGTAVRSAAAPLSNVCRTRPADCIAVLGTAATLEMRQASSGTAPQAPATRPVIRRQGIDLSLPRPLPK